jgi:hypothetical protein
MQREAQNVHYACCTHYNPNKDPVMPVCMASYMTVGYGHANHAF